MDVACVAFLWKVDGQHRPLVSPFVPALDAVPGLEVARIPSNGEECIVVPNDQAVAARGSVQLWERPPLVGFYVVLLAGGEYRKIGQYGLL